MIIVLHRSIAIAVMSAIYTQQCNEVLHILGFSFISFSYLLSLLSFYILLYFKEMHPPVVPINDTAAIDNSGKLFKKIITGTRLFSALVFSYYFYRSHDVRNTGIDIDKSIEYLISLVMIAYPDYILMVIKWFIRQNNNGK